MVDPEAQLGEASSGAAAPDQAGPGQGGRARGRRGLAGRVRGGGGLAGRVRGGGGLAGRVRGGGGLAGRVRGGGGLARSMGAVRSGAKATGRTVRAAGRTAGAGSSRLAAQVLAMAPRLQVREREMLLAQFPDLPTEDVAHALIDSAARTSAAVGGAVGAWAVLPVVPAFPVEVATETLALVAIEIKLVAELHEVYGARPAGSTVDRMTAYVAAWANRRGVALAPGGLVLAAGSPLRRRLQRRLAARAGKSTVSLGPLLTGAAAGALLNRWETRRLGEEVHADLRRRRVVIPGETARH
jgi:hypothetical protein